MQIKPKPSGFSLVELLIYMGLSSIILTVVAGLFVAVLESQLRSEQSSIMEQDSRYLIAKLSYEITQADELLIPAILGESANQLQLATSGQPVILELDNQDLEITKNGLVYQLNHSLTTVDNFQVTRLGNEEGQPVIQVNLTLSSQIQAEGQPSTKDYQITVSLR